MRRRRDNQKVRHVEGSFTPILDAEIDSVAFQELSGAAVRLFLFLKQLSRKLHYKLGEREPIFSFPYSRAKKRGMSESTTRRAFRDLWAKGFIDVVSIGGLRGAGRTNSQYKLANYWKTYEQQWRDRTQFGSDPFNRSEPD